MKTNIIYLIQLMIMFTVGTMVFGCPDSMTQEPITKTITMTIPVQGHSSIAE